MAPKLLWTVAVAIAIVGCSEKPKRKVFAVVVEINPKLTKWHPENLAVRIRTPDGLVGVKAILRSGLTCHVGNTVPATVQGVSLTLDEHACERSGVPPL
jgi:hypothetical protein